MSSSRSPSAQLQLAADQVELALLRVLERVVGGRRNRRTSRPSSGRAPAGRSVGDVVVVADGIAIACQRRAPSRQPRLDRRDRRTPQQARPPASRTRSRREPQPVGGRQRTPSKRAALRSTASRSPSTSSEPSTQARASPSWPGARSRCATAAGSRTTHRRCRLTLGGQLAPVPEPHADPG